METIWPIFVGAALGALGPLYVWIVGTEWGRNYAQALAIFRDGIVHLLTQSKDKRNAIHRDTLRVLAERIKRDSHIAGDEKLQELMTAILDENSK